MALTRPEEHQHAYRQRETRQHPLQLTRARRAGAPARLPAGRRPAGPARLAPLQDCQRPAPLPDARCLLSPTARRTTARRWHERRCCMGVMQCRPLGCSGAPCSLCPAPGSLPRGMATGAAAAARASQPPALRRLPTWGCARRATAAACRRGSGTQSYQPSLKRSEAPARTAQSELATHSQEHHWKLTIADWDRW